MLCCLPWLPMFSSCNEREINSSNWKSGDPLVGFIVTAWVLVLPVAVTYTVLLTMVRDKQRHDEVVDTCGCLFVSPPSASLDLTVRSRPSDCGFICFRFLVDLEIALMQISK